MRIDQCIRCETFPCTDVNTGVHLIPYADFDLSKIRMLMISESPPSEVNDYFYHRGNPGYLQTTIQAFGDSGIQVSSMQDILNRGIYITTAIKCAKTQYAISAATIKNCSRILERELAMFINIDVFLLMGDVAIKAFNYMSLKKEGQKTIPTGSTYKIRKQKFFFQEQRVFPSYLQTGKNYLIEKSKRRMIAEDIRTACKLIGIH